MGYRDTSNWTLRRERAVFHPIFTYGIGYAWRRLIEDDADILCIASFAVKYISLYLAEEPALLWASGFSETTDFCIVSE